MSYAGLKPVKEASEPHLGGNIREGDPYTFCPNVWRYAIDRFAIRSMLDLGSGLGYAANYFQRAGVYPIAVEGLKGNCDNAIFPSILWDLTKGPFLCNVDLVHCQEVAEHIEEKFVDNLLASMASGRFVLMTHAVPGQDGYHHVNLQPKEYWIDQLKRFGCEFLDEDTRRIREIASREGGHYIAKSGLIFANKHR